MRKAFEFLIGQLADDELDAVVISSFDMGGKLPHEVAFTELGDDEEDLVEGDLVDRCDVIVAPGSVDDALGDALLELVQQAACEASPKVEQAVAWLREQARSGEDPGQA